MRTTLSLDDDVVAHLKRLQAQSGRTWKQTVNDVARAGAAALETERRASRRAPRTKSVDLGALIVTDISNVHEVLSLVEGDSRS
jgi:hypothetical protein